MICYTSCDSGDEISTPDFDFELLQPVLFYLQVLVNSISTIVIRSAVIICLVILETYSITRMYAIIISPSYVIAAQPTMSIIL